jgi:hypothetical protein
MKLNVDEIITGASFGLCLFLILKFWVLLIAPLCAILWAMSGNGYSKLYRRLGCATVVLFPVTLLTGVYQCLYGILPIFAVMSLGYGIPATQPPDEGSFLGKIFYSITKNDLNATILTRLFIVFLLTLSFAPIYFIDKIHVYTAWYILTAGKLIAIFGNPQKEIKISWPLKVEVV